MSEWTPERLNILRAAAQLFYSAGNEVAAAEVAAAADYIERVMPVVEAAERQERIDSIGLRSDTCTCTLCMAVRAMREHESLPQVMTPARERK